MFDGLIESLFYDIYFLFVIPLFCFVLLKVYSFISTILTNSRLSFPYKKYLKQILVSQSIDIKIFVVCVFYQKKPSICYLRLRSWVTVATKSWPKVWPQTNKIAAGYLTHSKNIYIFLHLKHVQPHNINIHQNVTKNIIFPFFHIYIILLFFYNLYYYYFFFFYNLHQKHLCRRFGKWVILKTTTKAYVLKLTTIKSLSFTHMTSCYDDVINIVHLLPSPKRTCKNLFLHYIQFFFFFI